MSIITQFRLCPDHRARAVELFEQIVDALHQGPPYTEDQIVIWDGLERIVHRFIGSAQAVNHPIGVHSPDFWSHWHRFIDRNERLGRAHRRTSSPPPSENRTPAARVETPAARAETAESLDGASRIVPLNPTMLARLRIRPVLDNGTRIVAMTTIWGEEDATIAYENRSTATIDRDSEASASGPSKQADGPPSADLDATEEQASAPRFSTVPQPLAEAITPFSEAVKERLDALALKLGNRRADESHGRVLKFALDFLGDIPLSSLTKKNLRALELALPDIPTRKGLPRSACGSLHTRYEHARRHGWQGLGRVSKTTLTNTYFGTMNSFLAWGEQKYEWTAPEFRFD